MLMVAGGHFAGLVAQVRRSDEANAEDSGGKKKKHKPEIEVIKHKTFHRYTSQLFCFGLQKCSHNSAQHEGSKVARNP